VEAPGIHRVGRGHVPRYWLRPRRLDSRNARGANALGRFRRNLARRRSGGTSGRRLGGHCVERPLVRCRRMGVGSHRQRRSRSPRKGAMGKHAGYDGRDRRLGERACRCVGGRQSRSRPARSLNTGRMGPHVRTLLVTLMLVARSLRGAGTERWKLAWAIQWQVEDGFSERCARSATGSTSSRI
jgi:hypothetical protein